MSGPLISLLLILAIVTIISLIIYYLYKNRHNPCHNCPFAGKCEKKKNNKGCK